MFDNKKIMVVVAHPDDELLGLGGTMHKLIKSGNVSTHVVILGEGITSRADNRDTEKCKRELEIHRCNIKKAQEAIGYHSISTYNFADNRFDSHDFLDIVKIIEKEKQAFSPDIIFTHHGGDLNIDHQIKFRAVVTATRPMQHEIVRMIITFETPSGTEWQASNDPFKFSPNMFVNIEQEDLDAKIKGMEAYEFERREYPHPRSPKALQICAQYRGVQIGCAYAEAFQIIRILV